MVDRRGPRAERALNAHCPSVKLRWAYAASEYDSSCTASVHSHILLHTIHRSSRAEGISAQYAGVEHGQVLDWITSIHLIGTGHDTTVVDTTPWAGTGLDDLGILTNDYSYTY